MAPWVGLAALRRPLRLSASGSGTRAADASTFAPLFLSLVGAALPSSPTFSFFELGAQIRGAVKISSEALWE